MLSILINFSTQIYLNEFATKSHQNCTRHIMCEIQSNMGFVNAPNCVSIPSSDCHEKLSIAAVN